MVGKQLRMYIGSESRHVTLIFKSQGRILFATIQSIDMGLRPVVPHVE